jgi:Xaa-Pro aminopeptidase
MIAAGVSALRPGLAAGDLDALLQAELAARVPEGRCPHHTGHGLGLTFADPPQIVPDEPTALREGMTLTLSPGAYRPARYGVRVADVYLVTATGGVPVARGA